MKTPEAGNRRSAHRTSLLLKKKLRKGQPRKNLTQRRLLEPQQQKQHGKKPVKQRQVQQIPGLLQQAKKEKKDSEDDVVVVDLLQYPCCLCDHIFPSKPALAVHFFACCRSVLGTIPPATATTVPPPLPPAAECAFFANAGLNLRCSVAGHHRHAAATAASLESACISPDSELFWQPLLAVSGTGITSELGCRVPGLFPREMTDLQGYEKFCSTPPAPKPPSKVGGADFPVRCTGRIEKLRLSQRYCHYWSYYGCRSRVLRSRRDKRLTRLINNGDLRRHHQQQQQAVATKPCSVALQLPAPTQLGIRPCSVVLQRIADVNVAGDGRVGRPKQWRRRRRRNSSSQRGGDVSGNGGVAAMTRSASSLSSPSPAAPAGAALDLRLAASSHCWVVLERLDLEAVFRCHFPCKVVLRRQ